MNVYLAWRNSAWQGDTLLGVYSSRTAAQKRLDDTRERGEGIGSEGIEQVSLNHDTESWHGN